MLPALAEIEGIERVNLASRSRTKPDHWPKEGRFFSDYRDAIAESDADIVYISLPNSLHNEFIRAALAAGRHVVVDKPATLTLETARECVEEASRRSLLLAEATVFSYHPQLTEMQSFIAEYGPLTHIESALIIPPMPLDNFRNQRHLGGGCLNDMGPYAAAVARIFGVGDLQSLAVVGAPATSDVDVDLGFSLLASFSSGLRYSGHFSFESEYQNRLRLVGKSGSLEVERAFSTPPNYEPVWQVRERNQASKRQLPAADTFENFMQAVLAAIAECDYDRFAGDLIADALFRSRLATILEGKNSACNAQPIKGVR